MMNGCSPPSVDIPSGGQALRSILTDFFSLYSIKDFPQFTPLFYIFLSARRGRIQFSVVARCCYFRQAHLS
jgi:hypothetical protein